MKKLHLLKNKTLKILRKFKMDGNKIGRKEEKNDKERDRSDKKCRMKCV
jgi:hypothetical protein